MIDQEEKYMTDYTEELCGYSLSKAWFDFAVENPGKVKPKHATIFFWLIELNNRLNWPETFGVPTEYAMAMTGISSYNTYKDAFKDIVGWGFIEVLERSKNQYTSTMISLRIALSKNNNADFASSKNNNANTEHKQKHEQSTVDINKHINNKKDKPYNLMSEVFTPDYSPKKIFDSIAFKFWLQVYTNLTGKGIKPVSLMKSKIQSWENDIRLLIEKDGRTVEEINEILKFLDKDPFWANNIRSTAKLREQFENLLARSRTNIQSSKQMSIDFREAKQDYSVSLNEI